MSRAVRARACLWALSAVQAVVIFTFGVLAGDSTAIVTAALFVVVDVAVAAWTLAGDR